MTKDQSLRRWQKLQGFFNAFAMRDISAYFLKNGYDFRFTAATSMGATFYTCVLRLHLKIV